MMILSCVIKEWNQSHSANKECSDPLSTLLVNIWAPMTVVWDQILSSGYVNKAIKTKRTLCVNKEWLENSTQSLVPYYWCGSNVYADYCETFIIITGAGF